MRTKLRLIYTFLLILSASSNAHFAKDCQSLLNSKEDGQYKYWKGALSSTLRDFQKTRADVETFYFERLSKDAPGIEWRTRCAEEIAELQALNDKSRQKLVVASSSGTCLQLLSDYCNNWVTVGNKKEIPNSVLARRDFRHVMQSNEFKANACQVSDWVSAIAYSNNDNSRASLSEIFFGETVMQPKTRVALKIGYDDSKANTSEIERGFYRNYFDLILERGFSPNVTAYFGDLSCGRKDVAQGAGNPVFTNAINKSWRLIIGKNGENDRLKILVTEHVFGKSLSRANGTMNREDNWNLSNEDWESILFQIIYTLEVFNRLGLRHNDPHPGNIMIETKSEPVSMIYALDDKTFARLTTKQLVKFIDLDRASATCDKSLFHPQYAGLFDTLLAQNLCLSTESKLSGMTVLGPASTCYDIGRCNDRNIYYDVHFALSRILDEFFKYRLSGGGAFIRRNISAELLKANLLSFKEVEVHSWSLFGGGKRPRFAQNSYVPRNEKEMKAPIEMLKDEYFKSLYISKDEAITEACDKSIPFFHLPLLVAQPFDYWNAVIPSKCASGLPTPFRPSPDAASNAG